MCSTLYSELNFSVPPIDKDIIMIKQIGPFVELLSKTLKKDINLQYIHQYDKLYEHLTQAKIDFALVDSLTYLSIKKYTRQYTPIVYLSSSKPMECTLFAIDKNERTRFSSHIAFSGKYNACGYSILYHKNIDGSISYNERNSMGDNLNVLLEVLLGNFKIGIVPTSIFKRYKYLGLYSIQKLSSKSKYMIIANRKTITKKQMNQVKKTMLNKKINKARWHFSLQGKVYKFSSKDFTIFRDIRSMVQ